MTEDRVKEIAEAIAKRVMDEHLTTVAEASAKRAIQIVAADIGMSVMRKIGWAIGIAILGLLGWLGVHGMIKV
jgi:hypothetical protein